MHVTDVLPRKHDSSSEESIENILYYKDCQHKKETSERPVARADENPAPTKQPDCPFPKMCCSMSCGDDCGMSQSTFVGRQMGPMGKMSPMIFPPIEPISQSSRPLHMPPQPAMRRRKKKIKQPEPFGSGRRSFGFTKEKIKGLIAKDEDIRKILKDLVKITMQKVDLIEKVNTERPNDHIVSDVSQSSADLEF